MLPIRELQLAIKHNVASDIGIFFQLENDAKADRTMERLDAITSHCKSLTSKDEYMAWIRDITKHKADPSIGYRIVQAGNPKLFKELAKKGLWKWEKSTIEFEEYE